MFLKRIRDSLTLANAFALISMVCTFYLLFLVVVNFAVVRPTSTSKERVDIDSSNFPDVVACLDPPYNNNIYHGLTIVEGQRMVSLLVGTD